MKAERTLSNYIMVKMDPPNDSITTKHGDKLYIDNTFEPDKHTVVLGTVVAVPQHLNTKNMPWVTDMEIKLGDRVLMYYLAVQNCLRKEIKRYAKENQDTYIFISYANVYATIRDGKVIPVNGYLLVEPIKNPETEFRKAQFKGIGLDLITFDTKSNKDVVYGKIVYLGSPNKAYSQKYLSDTHTDLKKDDLVVMKRVRDIPVEYEYHAKIDNGRKLYRVQRHDILAILT